MNEIMNNILTRRSIRKFTDAPVSREILDDLVQAALHAPSGCGKQTWKFTVITNKAAIKRLADAIGTTLDRPGYNMYCPTAIIMPSNLRDRKHFSGRPLLRCRFRMDQPAPEYLRYSGDP